MIKEEKEYILIKYEDGDFSLDVKVDYQNKTVWLTQKDMSLLFDKSRTTITEHINNIFDENTLESMTYVGNSDINNHRPTKLYNLEVITVIGYHTKSKRITKFKEWCDSLFSNLDNNSLHKNIAKYSDKSYELVEFKDGDFSLSVNVSPDEDTVWLTQNDIALLFETTKQNVSLHIKNILSENELDISVVKDFFTTAQDGKLYQMKMYNLDMIIAIGYRVNSRKGTIFRRWATSILKQYLLNGYSINEDRCLACTSNIISLQNEVKEIESKIHNIENKINIENSKIFYKGEILDAYTFIRKLLYIAKREIIIVDYYADKFILSMLNDINVSITIITSTNSYLNKECIKNTIKVINNDDIHGRYLFIDDTGYIIDNSFNNIGKKRILMMKLEDSKDVLLKGII